MSVTSRILGRVSSVGNYLNRGSIRKASTTSLPNVVLVEGVRTPFLRSGTGYIKDDPYKLASQAIKGLLDRVDINRHEIDQVTLGTVIADVNTANIAREAAIINGLRDNTPCTTVTQACISSNQAITHCMNELQLGHCQVAISGGVETLSDAPIRFSKPMRQSMLALGKAKAIQDRLAIIAKMLNPKVWAPEAPAIAEFSTGETMGHSADRLAAAFQITREEQDEFAVRSHRLASQAQKSDLLVDVIRHTQSSSGLVSLDNGIRGDTTVAKMGNLKPAFVKDFGTVTGGNSSYLTDGASACLLTTEAKCKDLGLKPKAILRDYVFVTQDPKDQLLLGPAYAIPRLLARTGLTLSDIDVFEIHEAFAAQMLSCMKALTSDYFCTKHIGLKSKVGEIPLDKLNLWGGSLSLGHPFGATGVRLVTTAANRLIKEDGRYAIVAACAAGGQGHAMLVERYHQL